LSNPGGPQEINLPQKRPSASTLPMTRLSTGTTTSSNNSSGGTIVTLAVQQPYSSGTDDDKSDDYDDDVDDVSSSDSNSDIDTAASCSEVSSDIWSYSRNDIGLVFLRHGVESIVWRVSIDYHELGNRFEKQSENFIEKMEQNKGS